MKNRKAFTLVEIMIVVAIIALLAAIAIPNLLRSRIEANEAAAKAALKSISNAMENYYANNSRYPLNNTELTENPPYMNRNYLDGSNYDGFTYSPTFAAYTYHVDAVPISSSAGTRSLTLTTGGVITEN